LERRDQQACASIAATAAALTSNLEALKAVTTINDWSMFRPVVHYLDWRLRMMPTMSPGQTFAYHAQEYRTAQNLLCRAGSAAIQFVAMNHEAEESR
jgi:hypothetical protein